MSEEHSKLRFSRDELILDSDGLAEDVDFDLTSLLSELLSRDNLAFERVKRLKSAHGHRAR